MPPSSFLYDCLNSDNARAVVAWVHQHATCLFCQGAMQDLGELTRQMRYSTSPSDEAPDEEWVSVHRCVRCGWWTAKSPYLNTGGHLMAEVGYGQLRALDVADVSEPIEAVRSHLMVKEVDLLRVEPERFELLVASVFGDLGYRARVTNYSGDGGIDVYMDGPDDTLIGVQVKRWKAPIEIEQINALTGALFINGCDAGVFVTTSRYRSGAVKTAAKAKVRGLPIEIYDSRRFYEALEIAQATRQLEPTNPQAPWMTCEFKTYFKER